MLNVCRCEYEYVYVYAYVCVHVHVDVSKESHLQCAEETQASEGIEHAVLCGHEIHSVETDDITSSTTQS